MHGGYDVGQMNLEGRMLLYVSNKWFKREEKRKVTF